MNNLIVFAYYDGQWNSKNEYVDFKIVALLLPFDCNLRILKQPITDALHTCIPENDITVQYQVDQGLPPMKFDNDNAVKFYMKLKK